LINAQKAEMLAETKLWLPELWKVYSLFVLMSTR